MSYGLLRGAFRSPDALCPMRSYVRHRGQLIRDRSRAVQHLQKALTQMNVQLDNVLSDIMGKTGQLIVRAIVAGERDGAALAKFRDGRCKAGRDHHCGQPAGQLARRTPVRPATGVGPPRHAARPDRSVRGAHRRRTRRTSPGRGGERAVPGAACPRERCARAATPDAGGRLDRDTDGGRGDGPDRRRGGRCRRARVR